MRWTPTKDMVLAGRTAEGIAHERGIKLSSAMRSMQRYGRSSSGDGLKRKKRPGWTPSEIALLMQVYEMYYKKDYIGKAAALLGRSRFAVAHRASELKLGKQN